MDPEVSIPSTSPSLSTKYKVLIVLLLLTTLSFLAMSIYFLNLTKKNKIPAFNASEGNVVLEDLTQTENKCQMDKFNLETSGNGNSQKVKLYEVVSPFLKSNLVTKYKLTGDECIYTVNFFNNGWGSLYETREMGTSCNINFFKFLGIDKVLFTQNNLVYIITRDTNGEEVIKKIEIGNENENLAYVSSNVDKFISVRDNIAKAIYDSDGNLLLDLEEPLEDNKEIELFLDPINEGIVKITGIDDADYTNVEISYLVLDSLIFKSFTNLKYKLPLKATGCTGSHVDFLKSEINVTLGDCLTHTTPKSFKFSLNQLH